mgnify:CR=1 FL=1
MRSEYSASLALREGAARGAADAARSETARTALARARAALQSRNRSAWGAAFSILSGIFVPKCFP